MDDFALVEGIAQRLKRTLPQHVDVDDLVGAGCIGLMHARRGFDPTRGVQFTTYASRRIRGAMLDWLRDMDPISRSARARVVDDTTASLARPRSMDDVLPSGRRVHDLIPAPDAVDAVAARDEVEHLLAQFTPRTQKVLRLRFLDGLEMAEVGRRVGISESRVCRIIRRACPNHHSRDFNIRGTRTRRAVKRGRDLIAYWKQDSDAPGWPAKSTCRQRVDTFRKVIREIGEDPDAVNVKTLHIDRIFQIYREKNHHLQVSTLNQVKSAFTRAIMGFLHPDTEPKPRFPRPRTTTASG